MGLWQMRGSCREPREDGQGVQPHALGPGIGPSRGSGIGKINIDDDHEIINHIIQHR